MRDTASLKTDLYELTMAAGYFYHQTNLRATFELYCHSMPPKRSYLIACGLKQALEYILTLTFSSGDIKYLKSLPVFRKVDPKFFTYLRKFKFSGDVWAMDEGEICFANEPVLQVEAPIIEAQILETYLLSIFNIQMSVASKAARIVDAACHDGIKRSVVDFGSRRAHGPEAGVLAARAAYIGGCIGTSNVYAGKKFAMPIFGTMAHSWIQAFDSEEEAFTKYHEVFPEQTVLLIDTYDTLEGVTKAVKACQDFKAVRLDSGNINILSRKVRKILDRSGCKNVKIVASGDLNEDKIYDLVRLKAPVDMFGVGTQMVVSRDYPALDLTYKLVQTTDAQGRLRFRSKKSQGKQTVPGRKQVFRKSDSLGMMQKDHVGLFYEKPISGVKPLLRPVIKKGGMVKKLSPLERVRKNVTIKVGHLPSELRSLHHGSEYPVKYTPILDKIRDS